MPRLTLDALNAMDPQAFVAALGEVFEHAPWVAQATASGRPYATVAALHDAMAAAVRAAPADRQLGFIGGHPELGSRVGQAVDLTDSSKSEQGSLGLDSLSAAEFAAFSRLNRDYRDKFGIPFIICVRRHTRDSILRNFERRLGNDPAAEYAQALTEIGLITRLRINALVDGPGRPVTEGRLSTHVLDTVAGKPAAGIAVTLHEIGSSARGLIAQAVTNADGRTDKPLISGEPLRIGTYELTFEVGGYYTDGFLDRVPIRFGIAEPEGHYHVPLLMTPWSYTTYRGS
jgi:2-oxo-4-hydroxy-4-carboxy-5-ureidoimidazoline decarboxylase